MKKLNLIICFFILGAALPSQAKLYKFSYAQGKLLISEQASSWKEAYEKAAHRCFNHFAGSEGREKIRINRDLATDIIDICANPRRG